MAMPVPTAHTMMPKRRLDEVSIEQGPKNVPGPKDISNLGLKFTPDFRLSLCKGGFYLLHFWLFCFETFLDERELQNKSVGIYGG